MYLLAVNLIKPGKFWFLRTADWPPVIKYAYLFWCRLLLDYIYHCIKNKHRIILPIHKMLDLKSTYPSNFVCSSYNQTELSFFDFSTRTHYHHHHVVFLHSAKNFQFLLQLIKKPINVKTGYGNKLRYKTIIINTCIWQTFLIRLTKGRACYDWFID